MYSSNFIFSWLGGNFTVGFFCIFPRELRFQVRDDAVPAPPPAQKEVSIHHKHLKPKQLEAIQKREKLSALKSQHACV